MPKSTVSILLNTSPLFRKLLLIVTIIGFDMPLTYAQSYLRSSLAVLPNNNIKDTVGNFGYTRFSIGGGYAVMNKKNVEQKTLSRLYLNTNAAVSRIQYQPYLTDFNNLSLQVGGSYLYVKPKHLLMAQASAIWNATDQTFISAQPNLLVNGTYKKQVSQTFAWQLGLFYFTNFNRNILFPMGGIHYHFNPKNSIQLLVPFRLTYNHHISKKNLIQVGLLFNGLSTPTPVNDTILRNRQLLLSFGYRNNTSKQFRWFVTGSLAARGQVSLTANETFKQDLPRNFFIQAGFTYTLRKKAATFTPETDLFNLNNLSTEEISEELLKDDVPLE